MFSKFILNGILLDDFKEYERFGRDYYRRIKTDFQLKLEKIINNDMVIDGNKLQQHWFPEDNQYDVFLSHSHDDEDLAISLAGFLIKRLDLNVFIDSCLWGDSNDLLRRIDENYCRHSNGISFDYNKRNYSTSHVHMMLSIALSKMLDNCEAIFFLKSEKSISFDKEIEKKRTCSPWIYNELSLADMIQIKPVDNYRKRTSYLKHGVYESIDESSTLQIEYDIGGPLKRFISLSFKDLYQCAENWEKNDTHFQSALDYIYLSKDIIKKDR